MLLFRCAPQWPKAHFREASALQASNQPAAAVQVLRRAITTLAGTPNSGDVDIAATNQQKEAKAASSPPPPWVKEFCALIATCDKQAAQSATAAASAASAITTVKDPLELTTEVAKGEATERSNESSPSELSPLTAADWEYGDIMSPKAMAVFVVGFLAAGCFRSPILLTLVFSAAIATVIGAPDPRKQRARLQRREARRLARRNKAASESADSSSSSSSGVAGAAAVVAGDSEDESEEEDEGEFETEAGKLLSGWMAGGTGSTRGLGRRNAPPSDAPPAPMSQQEKAKLNPPSSKISKLAKLD